MARIVALPAAGEVVIAVEVLPVSQYDLMMISGNYGEATCPPISAQKESAARSQWAPKDAAEQTLSKTSLAELVRGVG